MTVAASVVLLLEAVRHAVERRGLSHAEVAQRVGVHERTIRRLLTGQTCSPALLDRTARALRVPSPGEGRSLSPIVASVSAAPAIVGWRQAALVLGVSPRTLQRWRRRARTTRHRPWWASADDCKAWARALVEGA